jgi:predicted metal-dependent peptidase
MKLTVEQRIERAHVRLMQDPNFCLFSGTFMVGKVTVSDTTPTAWTNGRDVTYGRAFVESLTDKQLAFLIVHEAMHKTYRHLTTWQGLFKKNKRLANMAADYVINLQIEDMDPNGYTVEMPRDPDGDLLGLLDRRFAGMDTKQVFDILLKEQTDKPKRKSNGQPEDGSTCPNGGEAGDGDDGEGTTLDEHDWEGASKLSQEERDQLERDIDQAIREGVILAGKRKGGVPRGIADLLTPKVDWKDALAEFVKTTAAGADQSTWRKPNRRYIANNIVMPSTYSLRIESIVWGMDTSGSISTELGRFLAEAKKLSVEVMPESVELLYWDTEVAGHESYRGSGIETFVESTHPQGGGGTRPDCVPAYLIEKQIRPQCVIMFTDGHFYDHAPELWQQLGVPVLWCVVGNKSFSPIYGQSVLVE